MALFMPCRRETGKSGAICVVPRDLFVVSVVVLCIALLSGNSPARAQSYGLSGYGSSSSSYTFGSEHHHRGNVKLAKKKKLLMARARLAAFGVGGMGPGVGGGLGMGQASIGGMMGSHSTASLMMRAAMMGKGGGGISPAQMRMGMMKMRMKVMMGGQGLNGTPYGANSIIQMRRPRGGGAGHGANLLQLAAEKGISKSQLHHIAEFSVTNGAPGGGAGGTGGSGEHSSEGNPLPKVDTYILGPGDVLRITVENHQDYNQDSVTIPPDGYLRLPFFDSSKAVQANGKTIPQVRELLRQALAKRMRDPLVAVTAESFRSTTLGQVFVIGAVKTPGPVDIKAGYRLTEVLAAVGGVDGRPEEMHALLTRAKAPGRELDLHGLISYPNSPANLHVLPNDVVTITPIDPGHIAVLGSVARPGVYDLREKPQAGLFEIAENPHLRDAIVAAGGLMAAPSGGDSSKGGDAAPAVYKATLVRKSLTSQLRLTEAIDEKDPDANIALESGDFINIEVVPPVPPITVYVDGQVKNPGSYQMAPGVGVLNAVAQAGGLVETDDKLVVTVRRAGAVLPVDLHSALFDENTAANLPLQDKDLVRLDDRPGMRVVVMGQVGKPAELHMSPNARLIDALAETGGLMLPPESAHIMIVRQKPNGTQIRLNIDAVLLEAGDLAQNAALQAGDVVNVSAVRTKSIFITGEVSKPGEFDVKGPISLTDLIAQAGGPTSKAALTRVEVQRGGKPNVVDTYGALREGQPLDWDLQDGDLVVVPAIPETLLVLEGVVKPGRYALPEKGTFTIADAILTAGGPRNLARTDQVALLRQTGINPETGYKMYTERIININDRTNPGATANLPLQAGDIVFVPQGTPSANKLSILTQVITGAIDLKVLSGY